jgi:hypothetical protein
MFLPKNIFNSHSVKILEEYCLFIATSFYRNMRRKKVVCDAGQNLNLFSQDPYAKRFLKDAKTTKTSYIANSGGILVILHSRAGMHNKVPVGQMWSAKALNLAREAKNLVCFFHKNTI